MNDFFRAIIAGYGAKKLGGGCLGTIVVFVLIWVALGQCSFSSREVPSPQTYPAKYMVYLEPVKNYRSLSTQGCEEGDASRVRIYFPDEDVAVMRFPEPV